jgi:hypothetical protein
MQSTQMFMPGIIFIPATLLSYVNYVDTKCQFYSQNTSIISPPLITIVGITLIEAVILS